MLERLVKIAIVKSSWINRRNLSTHEMWRFIYSKPLMVLGTHIFAKIILAKIFSWKTFRCHKTNFFRTHFFIYTSDLDSLFSRGKISSWEKCLKSYLIFGTKELGILGQTMRLLFFHESCSVFHSKMHVRSIRHNKSSNASVTFSFTGEIMC